MTAQEIIRCEECRRPLKTEASRAAKIGPRCAAIKAAAKDLSSRQRAKFRELLSDGAVIPTSRPGEFRLPSSDGSSTYRTTPRVCTCKWGRKAAGHPEMHGCIHRALVRLKVRPQIRAADRRTAFA